MGKEFNKSTTLIVAIIAQKGGVGKSFLARLIAREFAAVSWQTKIADLDISQGTATNWKIRREQHHIEPEIAVEPFRTIDQALRIADAYDLFVIDTPAHSTSATLEIAKKSDFSIIPTGLSLDDLEPAILLAHELTDKKILHNKIAFILSRVGDSKPEILEARSYINKAGYKVLDGELPEKALYRRTVDKGKAATEVSHTNLRNKARLVAQSIVNFITQDQDLDNN